MSMTPIAKPDPLPNGWHFPRRATFLVLLLAISAFVALVSLSEVTPRGDNVDGNGLIAVGSPDGFPVGVPVRPDDYPLAWIVREETGELIAFSTRSTHLGCTVPWRADFRFNGVTGWFRDPCSGTTWAITGERVFGPAPRNLDQYVVEVSGGQVRIDTSRVICGDDGRVVRRTPRSVWPCDPYLRP